MNALIISGVAISIFLLSLLLGKKKKLEADKFLIIYLVFFVISQTYFYLESFDFLQHSPWMLLGKGLYLLGGPMFFYYVYSLTTSKTISTALFFLTGLPFLSYTFHFLYLYFTGFHENEMEIRNGVLYVNEQLPVTWSFFTLLFLLSDPFYLIWFYWLLRKYKQRTLQSLSNTERINLSWLNCLFYVWGVSAIVLFPLTLLSLSGNWIPYSFIAVLLQIDYVIFIFIVGYFGFKQAVVFTDIEFDAAPLKLDEKYLPYERSGLSEDQAIVHHHKLLMVMKEQKPYLNGELTAQELSVQLGISPNHLSQVLNQQQEQNFFDFINSYRLEEVKQKMQDQQYRKYTLLAIALESGFNSKTSFNTLFKKATGYTPSQYYKSVNR